MSPHLRLGPQESHRSQPRVGSDPALALNGTITAGTDREPQALTNLRNICGSGKTQSAPEPKGNQNYPNESMLKCLENINVGQQSNAARCSNHSMSTLSNVGCGYILLIPKHCAAGPALFTFGHLKLLSCKSLATSSHRVRKRITSGSSWPPILLLRAAHGRKALILDASPCSSTSAYIHRVEPTV